MIALFIYIVIVQLVKGQAKKRKTWQQLEKEKQAALDKENPKPVVVEADILLLQEIRDLLKKRALACAFFSLFMIVYFKEVLI